MQKIKSAQNLASCPPHPYLIQSLLESLFIPYPELELNTPLDSSESQESQETREQEDETELELDLNNLGKKQPDAILTPKAKKAKRKLKKIRDAALSSEEVIDEQIDVSKRAKIQANKRNLNAQRIARATNTKQESSINHTLNNDTTEIEYSEFFNIARFFTLH